MRQMYISAAQPLYSLRMKVAAKTAQAKLGKLRNQPTLMKRAGRKVKRWANGSSILSWWRHFNRHARDNPASKLARAELFCKLFPELDWRAGSRREPWFYLFLHTHIYALKAGTTRSNEIVDEPLRWCFRADYLVANIIRLRDRVCQSCLTFSFQAWMCHGLEPWQLYPTKSAAFADLIGRFRATSIFPQSCMVYEKNLGTGERQPESFEIRLRPMRFLAAEMMDACIPPADWDAMLIEMQQLITRLGSSHKNSKICAMRDLL